MVLPLSNTCGNFWTNFDKMSTSSFSYWVVGITGNVDIEKESSDTKNMGDTGKKSFKLKQMNSAESWTIVLFLFWCKSLTGYAN
jgi:hypothetical protein